MGAISAAVDHFCSSIFIRIGLVILVLLAYPIYHIVNNLYFHPLAKIPGPSLWAVSRIPFCYHLLSGTLIRCQRQFHEKYGPVFRTGPNEVSFASEEALNDIYAWRPGHKRAMRDRAFLTPPDGQADNIVSTNDAKFHARVRGLLSNSFTDDALLQQSPHIERYVDTFIYQLWRRATAEENLTQGALVNFTDWLNFFTLDVIGDLALGEPFGYLAKGEYHEWIQPLYDYLRLVTLAGLSRFWPALQFLLEKMIPEKVKEGQRRHQKYVNDKVNYRLDSKMDRADFMTPFMKKNPDFEHMSREEILSSFHIILIAGSETSATTMTGIFNHLCMPQNKSILERLTREIRAKYASEEDIITATVKNPEQFPYLDAVINEGLRMCHPVPSGVARVAPPGGDEYAGFFIPEGTRIGVRIFAVNRSNKYFHNPDTFAPERWLPVGERPTEYDNDNLLASKPFSIGFHSCLGQPLALLEMRLILTRALWAFDLAEEEGMHVEFDNFPMMISVQKQPLMLRVRTREGIRYKELGGPHDLSL